MCQVMGFLMRRRLGSRAEAGIPKLGPPDLGFPTAGVGVSLPCPEGEQARRMVASHHPMCDTLAAPCRMGSRKALRTQIIFPLWFTHILHRRSTGMQDLPLLRNGLRSFFRTGVTLTAQNSPFCNPSASREHVSSDAHHSPFLNPL